MRTETVYDLVGVGAKSGIEQRVGTWRMEWRRDSAGRWRVGRWEAGVETRSRAPRRLFSDITAVALGGTASFREQMLRGTDDWRSQLDAAWGIDVYGNTGLAVGDFDGDGFDDLYVCEPAGLPNRLYRNRGDGTFEDVRETAGVGLLDDTACALFADFLNRGRQDLIVVRTAGPLLFLNQGGGRFELKPDAFRFAEQPQGTFTGAAAADYDGDGRLDVYFCLYSYYLGLNQYHYPLPYYDAQNGPPNFLFHNEGDGTFRDSTSETGLNQNNNRYSFACAWADFDGDGRPDLSVANDFGRKNLYHNNGNGTFTDLAGEAGVEDYGAGMSVCWVDYDNDGRPDLYVANMWSAAGQRLTQQPVFQPVAKDATRAAFRKHAAGNSLYRNSGRGKFQDATAQAGVAKGRWAWCADAWDFDHDGFADLYIADGFISGPKRLELSSFFWRQVVANSPLDTKPSPAYERGWNAINELIRSDGTWAGYQRNVFYANNRDGTFSDISGVVGLDFPEDSRAFALADFDHDGRLEVVLKSRNTPRLRILRNEMDAPGDVVAVLLRGRASGRDAIGAVVTVETESGRQAKTLQAGSGFLTQHTKELFFGLGERGGNVRLTVRWPNGSVQAHENIPRNQRIEIEEGLEKFRAKPFDPRRTAASPSAAARLAEGQDVARETWLVEPLAAPDFSLPDFENRMHSLHALAGRPALLTFWEAECPRSREQLTRIQASAAALRDRPWGWLAVNASEAGGLERIRAFAGEHRLTFPLLGGAADVVAIYDIIFRYLFDRRVDIAAPTSFLLDEQGRILKVYQGVFSADKFLKDWETRPRSLEERLRRATPFPGTYYGAALRRNHFNYGVAFFERGYDDHAVAAFKEAIAARRDDADAYYNLGTLFVRKQLLQEARENLDRAVSLKPNYPNAWINLGLISEREGKSEEAIRDFERAIQQDPGSAIAHLNLGNLYRRIGRPKDAQAALERGVELSPNDPEAVYSLAMFYAEQNDLGEARKYLERALQLEPNFPNALNNLGVLLLRSRDVAGAEREFEQCLRVAPDYEQAYLNLAQLEVALGHKDRARALLQEFHQRHPENKPVEEALRQLGP